MPKFRDVVAYHEQLTQARDARQVEMQAAAAALQEADQRLGVASDLMRNAVAQLTSAYVVQPDGDLRIYKADASPQGYHIEVARGPETEINVALPPDA